MCVGASSRPATRPPDGEDGAPCTWGEALRCIESGRKFIEAQMARETVLLAGSAEWTQGAAARAPDGEDETSDGRCWRRRHQRGTESRRNGRPGQGLDSLVSRILSPFELHRRPARSVSRCCAENLKA